MEAQRTPADGLDVQLRWPGGGSGPTDENDPRRGHEHGQSEADESAVVEDLGHSSRPEIRHLPEPVFITSADPGHAAFASIAIRLDALASATTMLRTVVSDRLSDYSERVERAQSAGGRDLDDHRRLQERSLSDIRAALSASEEALSVLKRASASLLDKLGEIDTNQEGRLDRVSQHIEQLTKVVVGLGTKPDVDLAPVIEGLEAIQAQLEPALRAAMEPDRAATAALLDKLGEIDTNQEGRLDRVNQHIEQLANAVIGLSAEPEVDLAPVIEGLETLQTQLEPAIRAAMDPDRAAAHAASVTAALERLEHTLTTTLAASPKSPTDILASMAEEMQQNLERQAAAQAEDLERILDTIEDLGRNQPVADAQSAVTPSPDLLAGLQNLADKIDSLPHPAPTPTPDILAGLQNLADKFDTLPQPIPTPTPDVLEGLKDLADKVESLRRRIALRARQEPVLDENAIESLATALANRLVLPYGGAGTDSAPPGSRRRGRRV